MQSEREKLESDSEWPGWKDREGGPARNPNVIPCVCVCVCPGGEQGFSNMGGFVFWLDHRVCTTVGRGQDQHGDQLTQQKWGRGMGGLDREEERGGWVEGYLGLRLVESERRRNQG